MVQIMLIDVYLLTATYTVILINELVRLVPVGDFGTRRVAVIYLAVIETLYDVESITPKGLLSALIHEKVLKIEYTRIG